MRCFALSLLSIPLFVNAAPGDPGSEWMKSAPSFCSAPHYERLSHQQQLQCSEAAFRYQSKQWKTVTAENGQEYEIGLDTIVHPVPSKSGVALHGASVSVYKREGAEFNPDNEFVIWFDCVDKFQTFGKTWSQVRYAPPKSIVAEISRIACRQQ